MIHNFLNRQNWYCNMILRLTESDVLHGVDQYHIQAKNIMKKRDVFTFYGWSSAKISRKSKVMHRNISQPQYNFRNVNKEGERYCNYGDLEMKKSIISLSGIVW